MAKKQEAEPQLMQFNPLDYPVRQSTREQMKLANSYIDLGALKIAASKELDVNAWAQTIVKVGTDGQYTIELID